MTPILGEYIPCKSKTVKVTVPWICPLKLVKQWSLREKTLQKITYGIPGCIYVYDLFLKCYIWEPQRRFPVRWGGGFHLPRSSRSSAWSFRLPPWPPSRPPGRLQMPSTMEPRTLPPKRPKAWGFDWVPLRVENGELVGLLGSY